MFLPSLNWLFLHHRVLNTKLVQRLAEPENGIFYEVYVYSSSTRTHALIHAPTAKYYTFSPSSQKLMFISQPFLVRGCFQPPTPTPYLPYSRSHHHLVPWEPLRNHRSGYNVPSATNTNVGVMLVLPTATDQSVDSCAH